MTDKILEALAFALAIDGKEIKSRSPMAVRKAADSSTRSRKDK